MNSSVHRKIVKTESTVVEQTICPASWPSAPMATAMGYEDTAAGAAKSTIIAQRLSPRKPIKMDNGIVIVEAGADITEEVLQKAKLANKFIELSMNVQ